MIIWDGSNKDGEAIRHCLWKDRKLVGMDWGLLAWRQVCGGYTENHRQSYIHDFIVNHYNIHFITFIG